MGAPDSKLVLPLAALFIAFFVAPLFVLLMLSLHDEVAMTSWTLGNYISFFTDRFSYSILIDTLLLGAKASARWQSILLFLVILPILTSVVVRTFSWIVILGRYGVLNQIMLALGLSREPLRLLYTEVGVVMVLAQVQMPLMVLPLLTNLQRIDVNLADASAALGAGAWRTFRRVILPLSVPGIAAGCTLVYAACVTAFITQTLIGGARHLYMPLFIYQQATGANDWPFAAALAIVFMAAVLLVVYLFNLLGRMRGAQLYA